MPTVADITPLLMPAPTAALYIGVSVSTLRSLNIPRRKLGSKRLYDRRDLDAYANDLPYDGQDEEHDEEKEGGENTCDGLFG